MIVVEIHGFEKKPKIFGKMCVPYNAHTSYLDSLLRVQQKLDVRYCFTITRNIALQKEVRMQI